MSAVLRGLRPGPGAIRLVLVRGLAWAALSGIAFLVIKGILGGGECGYGLCGPRPGELDLPGFSSVMQDAMSTGMGVVAGAAGLFWLLDQVVTAAALEVSSPRRKGPVAVAKALWTGVTVHLLVFLRIALIGLVLSAVWAGLVWKLTGLWEDTPKVEGWTGTWRAAVPVARALGVALGVSMVSAFTFWLRVLSVTDGRKRVRRTFFHGLRLLWRRPVRGIGLTWLLGLLATATLPATTPQAVWLSGPGAWAPWGLAAIASFVFWYWRIHVAVQVYADEALADLHARSDEPFGVWPWIKARASRLARRPAPAA